MRSTKQQMAAKQWKKFSYPIRAPKTMFPLGRSTGINQDLVFSYSTYALYRSLNSGVDWELYANTDQTAYVVDMQFISETTGYRLGLFGHLMKSTDGGAHWIEIYTPDPDAFSTYSSVYFVDEMTGYRGGADFEKSIDGGVTWTKMFANFYSGVAKLYFTDALHGYASGRARILYETLDGGVSWTEKWHGDTNDNLYDVQYKHGNIYLAGEGGFVGQISDPGQAPAQPGYIVGRDVVCIGDEQVYHLAENYSDTYEWNVSSGKTSDDGAIAFVQFPNAGEYTFTVNNFNNCGVSTSRSFTVQAVELSSPIISGPEFIDTEAANIRYDIINPESGVDYGWNAVGAKTFTMEDVDHTIVRWAPETKNGTIMVMASEPLSGCRASGQLLVSVDIVLGVEDESLNIAVYPNPTNSDLNVESSMVNISQMEIYDTQGKQYYSQELVPNQQSSIQLRSLPAGIYFLEIRDVNGRRIATRKIIKK